ncbi:MAG: hypothetical protein QOE28_3141 [Solirubrobacteraceae bacterium]|jgi:hypothetical protein|nr:hypothetical protein [Solirubrobacteraceae bacterium]
MTFVPITLAATGEVRSEDAGLASGLINGAQQVGGSIGLAVLATLATTRTASDLHTVAGPGSVLEARVAGFRVAFTAAAVLLGASRIIVALQLRTRHARGVNPVEVTPEAAARAVGCAQRAPVTIGLRQPDARAMSRL